MMLIVNTVAVVTICTTRNTNTNLNNGGGGIDNLYGDAVAKQEPGIWKQSCL